MGGKVILSSEVVQGKLHSSVAEEDRQVVVKIHNEQQENPGRSSRYNLWM